jgi:hypothetical protein
MASRFIIMICIGCLSLGSVAAQSGNAIGIRIGSAGVGFEIGGLSTDEVQAGFSAQLVKDWFKTERGFIRGRLGLLSQWTGTTLTNPGATSSARSHQLSVGIGRGHRITHGPFAMVFGADANLVLLPAGLVKQSSDQSDGTRISTTRQRVVTRGWGMDAGVFLELHWNLRRNLWIGLEQNFNFGFRYAQSEQRKTYEEVDIQTGSSENSFSSKTKRETGFYHPFYYSPPLFSLTYRLGDK